MPTQLKPFLSDIADAIRTKKGTNDSINAQDFASEIASIPTGGGYSIDELIKFGQPTIPLFFPYNSLSGGITFNAMGTAPALSFFDFSTDNRAYTKVTKSNALVTVTGADGNNYVGLNGINAFEYVGVTGNYVNRSGTLKVISISKSLGQIYEESATFAGTAKVYSNGNLFIILPYNTDRAVLRLWFEPTE